MKEKSFIFANMGKQARKSSKQIASASTIQKNEALSRLIDQLRSNADYIIAENQKDIDFSKEKGLSDPMIDRLCLNHDRIDHMCESIAKVIVLDDIVGEISELKVMPSGIQVGRMRNPIGVIGVIYESRPNVTSDVAALCLKSGNSVILRGGKEAIHSNFAIAQLIQKALIESELNPYIVQIIPVCDRRIIQEMITHPEWIDLIIPRGGRQLIEAVAQETKVPVLKHLDGLCHTYVDRYSKADEVAPIVLNAKTRRYGICNATETLLVHQKISQSVLELLVPEFLSKQIELYGCERTLKLFPSLNPASEKDWSTEYLAPILSIRIVKSLEQAIEHIQTYGSGHTDAILTTHIERANQFVRQVDSSSVMVNCSTQFADGFEYGLGAEVGISTDKLHARGPIGLEGLTNQKYVVYGKNSIRS